MQAACTSASMGWPQAATALCLDTLLKKVAHSFATTACARQVLAVPAVHASFSVSCPETAAVLCCAWLSWNCLEAPLKWMLPAGVQVHIDGAVKHLAPLRLLFEKAPEAAAPKAPSTAVSGILATEGKPADAKLSARRSFW